jgi:hypothetical protein
VNHNARKGVQYELSWGGKIFGNVIWENGWATPSGNDGAAITLHNSSSTEVYNTLAWTPDSIAIFALNREGTKYDVLHDVYVHDNTLLGKNDTSEVKNHLAFGWFQGWTTTLFDPVNDNRGANNRYWYTTPEGSLPRNVWKRNYYAKLSLTTSLRASRTDATSPRAKRTPRWRTRISPPVLNHTNVRIIVVVDKCAG